MTRPIEFRAWDRENKKMQWPCEISLGDLQGSPIHRTFENGSIETCPPNPGVIEDYDLMQFTGLYDKNGKEIFEGDIVRYLPVGSTTSMVGCVTYKKEKASYGMIAENKRFYHLYYDVFGEPHVIGNIHQNPDLL